MKKIFMVFAAVCALVACDPVHEDISNGEHISAEELKAMSTVTVDKTASGLYGNVVTCSTSAPVNAKWDIGGKEFVGNYAWKKMKVKWDVVNGDTVYFTTPYTVVLTAICPDGTKLTAEYPIQCDDVTNPLVKYYIYGDPNRTEDEKAEDPQLPFRPGAWDAAAMRFSSTEGAHFPTIPDDVYFGLKTLIFDISEVSEGTTMMVHNGWWSETYYDNVPLKDGPNEIQITQQIANTCAKGGDGKDLQFLIKSGGCTVNYVYYEE